MTLRKSETLLRALVALALGIGFVGFATHAHTAAPAGAETATPIVDGAAHAGL